jgi:hypothetical protein
MAASRAWQGLAALHRRQTCTCACSTVNGHDNSSSVGLCFESMPARYAADLFGCSCLCCCCRCCCCRCCCYSWACWASLPGLAAFTFALLSFSVEVSHSLNSRNPVLLYVKEAQDTSHSAVCELLAGRLYLSFQDSDSHEIRMSSVRLARRLFVMTTAM